MEQLYKFTVENGETSMYVPSVGKQPLRAIKLIDYPNIDYPSEVNVIKTYRDFVYEISLFILEDCLLEIYDENLNKLQIIPCIKNLQ